MEDANESSDDRRAHLNSYLRGRRVAELAWHLIRDHGLTLDAATDTLDAAALFTLHERLHRPDNTTE